MTKLTLKVITQILDENGNPVKSSSCSAPLGDVDEFDHEAKKNGFVQAFDSVEKQMVKVHRQSGNEMMSGFINAVNEKKNGQETKQRESFFRSEVGCIRASSDSEWFRGFKPKEHVLSLGVEDIIIRSAVSMSYRDSFCLLNRIWNLPEADMLKERTLWDRIDAEGIRAIKAVDNAAEKALHKYHYEQAGDLVKLAKQDPAYGRGSPQNPDMEQKIRTAIAQLNSIPDRPEWAMLDAGEIRIESKDSSVCIAIDDIGVKKQKDKRQKPEAEKQGNKDDPEWCHRTAAKLTDARLDRKAPRKKYVETTNVHIVTGSRHYVITTAQGLEHAFMLLMAFLLQNDLIRNHDIVFFTDGAKCIQDNIKKYFCGHEYLLILDFYHLIKHCEQGLSMAISKPAIRNEILYGNLSGMLWNGKTDQAVKYLSELPDSAVKNKAQLQDVIDYIERKKEGITTLSIRRWLGMKIGSRDVEKDNDMIVASRQKHNGMSWNREGSSNLSALTAMIRNGQMNSFILGKKLNFSPRYLQCSIGSVLAFA